MNQTITAKHQPITLYAFMGSGEEPISEKKKPSTGAIRKVRTRVVFSAGDTGFLDECFDNEAPPVFTPEENIDLHRVLLEQSCNELHEAFKAKDYVMLRDILSWIRDDSWQRFSFLVCAAIVDIDPQVFRYQISMHMKDYNISKEMLCLN